MKRARIFWCWVVVCSSWRIVIAQQQQQPTNPMPAAAAGIVAQMDKEILASKKKATDALEKVLKDTTKKGDLAGAMAVKQTLDRLNAEIAAIAANRAGRGPADIVGRWQGQGQQWIVEYLPDGKVTCTDAGGLTGTWTVNGTAVEATFTNGVVHVMERTADGWQGSSKSSARAPMAVRYVRIP